MSISMTLLMQLRYACPCNAGEVLQVQDTCHLEDGEDFFIMRMRALYRKAIGEIKAHETRPIEPIADRDDRNAMDGSLMR